jgi:precorrin-3B methylase
MNRLQKATAKNQGRPASPTSAGHPKVYAAAEHTIKIARQHGTQVTVGAAPHKICLEAARAAMR